MSAKENKEIVAGFKLNSIRILVKNVLFPVVDSTSDGETSFQISIQVGQSKETKSVSTTLTVILKRNESEDICASFKIQCEYQFVNFDDIFGNEGAASNVTSQVIETINIITMGTMRGIMFSELSGTWLQNEILPVIDPKSFTEQK